MERKQKVQYTETALRIAGFAFSKEHTDLILSIFELVTEKKGSANLEDIVKIKADHHKRWEEARETAKLLEE